MCSFASFLVASPFHQITCPTLHEGLVVFKIESATCPQKPNRTNVKNTTSGQLFLKSIRICLSWNRVSGRCLLQCCWSECWFFGLMVATNPQNMYSDWLKSRQFKMPSKFTYKFGIANIPPISILFVFPKHIMSLHWFECCYFPKHPTRQSCKYSTKIWSRIHTKNWLKTYKPSNKQIKQFRSPTSPHLHIHVRALQRVGKAIHAQ